MNKVSKFIDDYMTNFGQEPTYAQVVEFALKDVAKPQGDFETLHIQENEKLSCYDITDVKTGEYINHKLDKVFIDIDALVVPNTKVMLLEYELEDARKYNDSLRQIKSKMTEEINELTKKVNDMKVELTKLKESL